MIDISEAFELYKLYNRYISLLNKTSSMSHEELRNEIQNLPWDTLMFAFSVYYEKKPYLSELIQTVQLFIWKICVALSSEIYINGSKYLNHSLQENPENVYITDQNDDLIKEIIDDDNFKNLINSLIKENNSNNSFESTTILNFKKTDLFLALNNTTTTITAIKEQSIWKLHIVITDTYDFTDLKELNEYIEDGILRGFIGSFLNNSAMASSAFNVINTYDIKVEFDYEVEV